MKKIIFRVFDIDKSSYRHDGIEIDGVIGRLKDDGIVINKEDCGFFSLKVTENDINNLAIRTSTAFSEERLFVSYMLLTEVPEENCK